ncbi:hypothetical protein [Methylobacter marinus]|uniref:hypothetical protein n=1 Tax=Methylobacter marinus TaxID=34058 RepID=UPI0003A9E3B3|nr:hypothetical protein [Methylobacter marinus]
MSRHSDDREEGVNTWKMKLVQDGGDASIADDAHRISPAILWRLSREANNNNNDRPDKH